MNFEAEIVTFKRKLGCLRGRRGRISGAASKIRVLGLKTLIDL